MTSHEDAFLIRIINACATVQATAEHARRDGMEGPPEAEAGFALNHRERLTRDIGALYEVLRLAAINHVFEMPRYERQRVESQS